MNTTIAALCLDAVDLIKNRQFDDAIRLLKQELRTDRTGEYHALLGLACFHKQDYASAAMYYEQAVQLREDNTDWKEMRERARRNAEAGVNTFVPSVYYFDRQTLLARPDVGGDVLPSLLAPIPPSASQRILALVGTCLGTLISGPAHFLVHVYGKLCGYHSGLWTNWYKRGRVRGILTLAYMRDLLTKNNLNSTYPKGSLVAFQRERQEPPAGAHCFRTADGSWNNLRDPKEGAAGTRFLRNVGNAAIRPESGEELLTPNPREISRKLLTRADPMSEIPFLNLLAAAWIQFQVHDWVSHGENQPEGDPIEIPLTEDDPIRRKYHQVTMRIARTQSDPTYGTRPEEMRVTYINEVTHWWDGSQIYGSDQETQNRLRSRIDGKLKLTDDGRLRLGENGVEDTGFTRNWWVGLSMLHTLFAKEHNAICDRLKSKYPHWDDNRLFSVARLINAAVIAKIHTVEWTPAILPNPEANLALNANWFGIATFLFRDRKSRRAKATLNITQPEVGGVVGNPIDKHGSPFGLTEEFVEVYRLHSLLPEKLKLRRIEDGEEIEEVPFSLSRQAGSPKLTGEYGMASLFLSFGKQHPGYLKLNNYPHFLREISVPGNPVLDMGAVDILRARERGVPRYNKFRQQLGLRPIRCFEDLSDNQQEIRALKEVYGEGPEAVNRLDLLVGTLAEDTKKVRPAKFGFGETLFQIFILNATRRLQADRFYTDNYNEETYTKEGMDWIDDADLKTVILRHYPELASTGLANVRNAFEPWDETPELDASRHPLREYDNELAPNPWIGDAHR